VASTTPITATEILDEVIQPVESSFSREFADTVLQIRMSEKAQKRIRDLLQRNNAGALEPAEKAALDNYLLVGQFIDLLQAKARASLQRRSSR